MAMSNEEITNEFATLFGDETTPADEEIDETPTEGEEETEDADEHEDETETDDDSEKEDKSEEEEKPDDKPVNKKQAKQNYAFAQQRQQIKYYEASIKQLGTLMGMENAKPEEIQQRLQEVLLEKQSKEQNVPVELLQRLERAEAVVRENQEIKLQAQLQSSIADLVEKHNLDPESLEEFTQYLIDNDKNPMEHPEIDLDAEYLKLHYEDMIQAAVQEALDKEKTRKDKVKDKSATPVSGGGDNPDEAKINSVADLDKLFGSMDL